MKMTTTVTGYVELSYIFRSLQRWVMILLNVFILNYVKNCKKNSKRGSYSLKNNIFLLAANSSI